MAGEVRLYGPFDVPGADADGYTTSDDIITALTGSVVAADTLIAIPVAGGKKVFYTVVKA